MNLALDQWRKYIFEPGGKLSWKGPTDPLILNLRVATQRWGRRIILLGRLFFVNISSAINSKIEKAFGNF